MMREISDEHALNLITDIMSANDWSADTLEEIADIVRMSGRDILDTDEEQ
jgi:hypothetical protein